MQFGRHSEENPPKISVEKSKTIGWDVHITSDAGEVVTHCEDWHRLERTIARLHRASYRSTSEAEHP